MVLNNNNFELTKNNHFEFGRLLDDEDCFLSVVGSCSPQLYTAFEQARLDARYIFEKSNQPHIELFLSGGIDSECMLESFLAARVPIKAHIFRFKDGWNDFDIQTNICRCKDLSVPLEIHECDIINFLESGEVFKIADRYECQSPQIAAHLWMLDQVEGFPCLSGNPIAPVWRNNSWFYVGLPGELHSAYFKYFLINNRPGVPWFFLYSPELIKSFFQLPVMQKYLNKEVSMTEVYSYLEKCRSYRQAGFQALPRANKFTGFERIREHYDLKMGTQFGAGFNQLFRRPLEEKRPFPEKYFQLVPLDLFGQENKTEVFTL